MKQTDIMLPVAANVALSALVAGKMLLDRVGDIATRKVKLSDVATSAGHGKYTKVLAADNFKNQFEMPVLLYALAPALMYAERVSPGYVRAAWAYVALRTVHAAIHIGHNNVRHRFVVFLASACVIYGMWGWFAVQLVTASA